MIQLDAIKRNFSKSNKENEDKFITKLKQFNYNEKKQGKLNRLNTRRINSGVIRIINGEVNEG